ncbi:MAG: GNAT family N-acetyltransferase [Pelagibacterium sp. SCN 64-44]|nr:MAG: GNAT family N-acetyltransferase [Pelagibacterium sp. SCN 64-44]
MNRNAPILETDRLILRPISLEDYPGYARIMQSSRAIHMGGPLGPRETWGMFCHCVASWDLFGHGALMIERRELPGAIGMVSINDGPLFVEKELGWFLYDGYEGHGFATEAAAALKDWAFTELRVATLVSYFDPQNVKSLAVARRLGGVQDFEAEVSDPGDLVFRYDRP